jgi:DUF1365 family protein
VSFYLIEGNFKTHAIIEIGNTFGELKPYYVAPTYFDNQSFQIKFTKEFYISPFLPLSNSLEFKLKWNDEALSIHINDYGQSNQLEFNCKL